MGKKSILLMVINTYFNRHAYRMLTISLLHIRLFCQYWINLNKFHQLSSVKTQFIFVFVCLSSIIGAYGQQYNFEHFNERNGLSHNSIRHIAQDNNGFLWFGTFAGLNRFDGYQFKSYTAESGENSIKNNDITALEYDESLNNLWIGTRLGLTVLNIDTHEFKTFLPDENNPKSIKEAEIRAVYLDKFNRVWVGTQKEGLFVLYPNEDRFVKVEIEGFNYIKKIHEDKKGNIWIGSYQTGSIAKITLDSHGEISNLNTYSLSIPNSDEKNPYVNFIYEDDKSDIFVGTRVGLYKLDLETDTFKNIYTSDDELRKKLSPDFLSIARAPNGKYWIGTYRGLLVCDQIEDIEKGDFEWHYSMVSENTSLGDDLIFALYFDLSGILWIGTENGLDKFDPFENQFINNKDISHQINSSLPRIKGFAKTYDSKLIVATQHDGMFVFENNEFVSLYKGKFDIASIYSEDGKIFYCGLWNGDLLIYNYKNNTSKIVNTGLNEKPIVTITAYNDDNIILGSYGKGITIINKESFEKSVPPGLLIPDSEITKIINDGFGNLWILAQSGMLRYDLKTKLIVNYKSESENQFGLPNNEVSDVVIISEKEIWVATKSGLAKYLPSSDRFETISSHKELVGGWIKDMILVNENDLWLNLNNNKIGKYNLKQETLKMYHANSGNRLTVFSSSGFFSLNDTRIYLAGKSGIIYFSPNEIENNQWSPAPVITEFKIQNEEVLPGIKINGQTPLKFDLNYKKEVELDFANRNFSIQFSAPSFSNRKMNKFQYMLEGFEEDWIETGNDVRTIQYTNLSPGDYVFKVKASNSDGIWSEISSYNVKIHPVFWLSKQGLLLILSILIMLTYFIRKQVKNRLELKKSLLKEQIEREQDEKLNDEKLQFFTNISHEFRTPLTLISGPLEQLLSDYRGSHTRYKKLKVIENSTNHLLKLINRLMDFRKIDNKKFQLRSSEGNIVELLKEIHLSFNEYAKNGNYTYTFETSHDEIMVYYDQSKLEQVFYNLISNAFRYSTKGGAIKLKLIKNKKDICIKVSDTGVGIAEEHIEKVFDRFFEIPTHNRPKDAYSKGTGIGLAIAKNLVELHKGTIKVKNRAEKGAVFSIKIPLGKDHLLADEIVDEKKNSDNLHHYTAQLNETELDTTIDLTDYTIEEGRPTILIVEDNNTMRSFIKDILYKNYNILEAENGKIAFNMVLKSTPDVIVSDVVMPEMNGTELCAKIKENLKTSHIPVILVTARSSATFKFEGLENGADAYISKPFSIKELKLKVKNILENTERLKKKFSNENNFVPNDIVISSVDEQLLKKAFEIVEANIDNDQFDTMRFCSELGISRTMLFTKIKAWTNLTPNDFILEIRMKRAAQLLEQDKINISEICYSIGFRSPKYFGKLFRKKFGESPSQYRNKFSKIFE